MDRLIDIPSTRLRRDFGALYVAQAFMPGYPGPTQIPFPAPSGASGDVHRARIPSALLPPHLGHNRDPQLFRELRPAFLQLLHEEAEKRGGIPLRHNAMPDHVHLLVRLPPTLAVSEFLGQVKGATAFRANRELDPKFKIRWQEGYGAMTLRKQEIDAVARYTDQQEEHHGGGRLSRLLECVVAEGDEGP